MGRKLQLEHDVLTDLQKLQQLVQYAELLHSVATLDLHFLEIRNTATVHITISTGTNKDQPSFLRN